MNRIVLFLVVVAVAISAESRPVQAQRRGEVLEGLFKSILETHLDREGRKQHDDEQRRSRRQHPGKPRPGDTRALPRGATTIESCRRTLQAYIRQADALALHLHRSLSVRGLRPLLADCWKWKAQASVTYQRCLQVDDLTRFSKEYADLDCAWRNISYKLQSLEGLEQACTACIRRMDAYGDNMCELLGVDPQFDRERMFALMLQSATYIDTLVDDIKYELYDRRECEALLVQGNRLMDRMRHESQSVRNAAYDEIAPSFNEFATQWRRFSAELYKFKHPSIQRRLAKVRSCNEQIYELLWMPAATDRGYIDYLAGSMNDEITTLLQQMSVQTLISLPIDQQRAVLEAAHQLQRQCAGYAQLVKQQRSIAELRRQFREVDRQWTLLAPMMRSTESSKLARCHNEIRGHCRDTRMVLGMRQQFDYELATRLAAALEGLSEELQANVHRYNRYYLGSDFRNQSIQSATAFYDQSKKLRDLLSKGRNLGELQQSCDQMVQSWTTLSSLIDNMPQRGLSESRYQRVDDSRQEVVQIVAELAAMLTA